MRIIFIKIILESRGLFVVVRWLCILLFYNEHHTLSISPSFYKPSFFFLSQVGFVSSAKGLFFNPADVCRVPSLGSDHDGPENYRRFGGRGLPLTTPTGPLWGHSPRVSTCFCGRGGCCWLWGLRLGFDFSGCFGDWKPNLSEWPIVAQSRETVGPRDQPP